MRRTARLRRVKCNSQGICRSSRVVVVRPSIPRLRGRGRRSPPTGSAMFALRGTQSGPTMGEARSRHKHHRSLLSHYGTPCVWDSPKLVKYRRWYGGRHSVLLMTRKTSLYSLHQAWRRQHLAGRVFSSMRSALATRPSSSVTVGSSCLRVFIQVSFLLGSPGLVIVEC